MPSFEVGGGGFAVASLALLLFTPVLLLGADYLFDEVLHVRAELRTAGHYRSFLYLSVISVSLIVILQSQGSYTYFETFKVTTESLFRILVLLLFAFFMGKWILRQSWSSQERKRIEMLDLELPQYLEMFHILITSGMSVLSALKMLSQSGSVTIPGQIGFYARDGSPSKVSFFSTKRNPQQASMKKTDSVMKRVISEVLNGVEQGMAIERALDQAVMRSRSEQLRRFSDAVILGMDRGSSMGQTLRNLITETRNQSKVLIMQRAGKAEIQLLIPVVFLILPISVMFAIWPSYVNLASIMGG